MGVLEDGRGQIGGVFMHAIAIVQRFGCVFLQYLRLHIKNRKSLRWRCAQGGNAHSHLSDLLINEYCLRDFNYNGCMNCPILTMGEALGRGREVRGIGDGHGLSGTQSEFSGIHKIFDALLPPQKR